MTRQMMVVELVDEDEDDSVDMSLLLEEILERNLPKGTTYLLTEYEEDARPA